MVGATTRLPEGRYSSPTIDALIPASWSPRKAPADLDQGSSVPTMKIRRADMVSLHHATAGAICWFGSGPIETTFGDSSNPSWRLG